MKNRRSFLAGSLLGVAGLAAHRTVLTAAPARQGRGIPPLRQSVCRWPFGNIPYDQFCAMVKRLGFGAVDLVDQKDWALVKKHGLAISTANSSPRGDFIARGLNNPANHATILGELEAVIPAAAEAGASNVIAMFGNRVEGIDDAAGIANCATGLAKVAPLAEKYGITIILEMLNSRVDHRNFQGDRTSFGVAVCEKVGSPRVRLLYDIYHMQIMEGDVIRTIRQNQKWIAHFHTAGNPGRNELNTKQELQYGAIADAISEIGFTGWLAHEFVPTGDPAAGLKEARDQVAGG